jgi:SIT4-associating protein SAP185/190
VLIKEMLRGGNPLTVGVGIVIEVIRKNNSDYDLDNQIGPIPRSSDPIYLGSLLRQFSSSVPDFMTLILDPDHKVVTSDGTVVPRRKEMKAASGEKIEPLGFDRFKTCELMAELLHCSNMALLNDRGAEEGIRQRDAERERLKAEGKLQPRREEMDQTQEPEFGTSVDSSGFHHARAPSDESPEEIKRLEVSNSAEDEDFETVDALADEIKGELDDALVGGDSLDKSSKDVPMGLAMDRDASSAAGLDEVAPLKPRRPDESATSSSSDKLANDVQALDLNRTNASDGSTQDRPKTPTSPNTRKHLDIALRGSS